MKPLNELTDDELAVAVAVEIWGWKRSLFSGDPFWGSGKVSYISEKYLKDEVFSWSGFGRTIDAMAEMGYFPFMNDMWDVGFYHRDSSVGPLFTYCANDIKTLIRTVHLAALEAKRSMK